MRHNKKRNLGILYEQLLKYVARSMVLQEKENTDKATKIIKEHFAPGKEIYREFRLFKALANSHSSSEVLASRVITEASKAARSHSVSTIQQEKSSLIKDINYSLGNDFYTLQVENYKTYATIQYLINEWRSDTPDVAYLAEYEGKLLEKMTTPVETIDINSHSNKEVDNLVVRIMTEKFNKKYSSQLNEDQQKLIRLSVFSNDRYGKQKLIENMCLAKEKCLILIEEYASETSNTTISEKIDSIRSSISSLDYRDTSDDNIIKFLEVSKLVEELQTNE